VPSDRRARRRQETVEEILDIANAVMLEEGVNGLSIAEVARRLGVQPPSLYKYFSSLMAVYDALFLRAAREHLAVMREAMATAEPGLAALIAGLDAAGRWSVENRALAQLLFWRTVPSFEPSPESFAPSVEMVALNRQGLADAVAAGQLGPEADSEEGIAFLSIISSGTFSQSVANEPELPWGEGRFSPLFPKLMHLLPAAYPPKRTAKSRGTTPVRSSGAADRAARSSPRTPRPSGT
jgi:AcrR family transcriptional regulator